MKRITVMGLVLCLALFCFVSCKKDADVPKAGTAKATDILNLIPADVQGVFFVDVNNAMSTEFADKMIKDDENYQKYLEFVEKSGIDPQKDIYYVAIGIAGDLEGEDQEGVAVINMKYDPEIVLGLIKEKTAEEGQEIQEEQYGDYTLYKIWQEGNPVEFSFIDESNIVAGNEIHVKSVLDVLDKKKDNVFKNEDLSAIIDKTNKDAMLWGAILLPPETMEKAASSNPMMGALKSISAIALYFDYKNQNIIAEILAMGPDTDSNKQVAEALTGIKSFGAMAAGEKPEIGELLNAIQISSGDDHVKIFAEIPEELINKLQADKPEEEKEIN
ncbi:MAG: hypothetical protein JSV17_07115 [Candidatus Aminicenantes bacterium]|nr:MAG: hypothetical protein JSV17_07115 [Candidatus Aminicenantes bacterium]